MSGDNFFLDTNVLLYRFSASTPDKQLRADLWVDCLWRLGCGQVSWQVIFEFYSNLVRKMKTPPSVGRQATEELMRWNPRVPSNAMLERAWHWCDSAQVSFWDALIVATAEHAKCTWLLSEDFQAGRRFGPVTVINPFERHPSEFGLA